jgi:CRP/FNR family transcriptional regulator, anaerobic regulatory protein
MKDRLPHLYELYPVLRSVPQHELDATLQNARLVSLKSGTIVFEELQSCRAFPFVLSGHVRVVKRSETGREIALYSVTPGDACVVSSACLLGNKPYNAVGIVQADCELVMMPAQDFDRLMSLQPFREFIFSLFSRRVLELMLLVDEVAFRKLDQRLARLLIGRGPAVTVSHQDLADELGTVREMITRTLHGFAERGLVRLTRGSVEVLDAQGLERICAG